MAAESSAKFYLTVALTLIGIAVPILIWRADSNPKSVEINIISQTGLQPELPHVIRDIKVVAEGIELKDPYLTVMEIRNDGAKALPTSDFESAIEIRSNKATIIRAQITKTEPSNLEPSIRFESRSISVAPQLLNPNDMITLAVLTSDGIPTFGARARINGIKELKISRSDDRKKRSPTWARAITAFSLLAAYMAIMPLVMTGSSRKVGPALLLLAGIASAAGSVLLTQTFTQDWNPGFWPKVATITGFALLALLAGYLVNHRHRSKF